MTAGPRERSLHVIDGGGPESEQEAEARIREDLRRRGVGPGGPASSPPPMPAHPPTSPAQPTAAEEPREGQLIADRYRLLAKVGHSDPEPQDETQGKAARADNDRLPPWWERHRPHLKPAAATAAADEEPDDEGPDGEERDGDDVEEPTPRAAAPRRVSKTGKDDDGPEAGEEHAPAGPRWSRPALGRPPGLPPKKKNLITWWRQDVKPEHKWLLYHGTGLGAGVYLGVFSYGTRGAEFVTQQGLHDLDADVTLGLLVLVLLVDYRVRNLFPPLAWLVRAASTSLVLGAAWNGTPLADLTN